jgi:hypothetical protein
MMFHKASKKAFLCPTKVGTFTICHFLTSVGWKSLGGPHRFFEEYAGKYSNLLQYQVYCFMRDPLARFESAILHIKQMPYTRDDFQRFIDEQGINKAAEQVSYDEVVDMIPALPIKFEMLFKPQAEWFTHSNIQALDFHNMEAELRRVTGNTEQPLVRYNTSTDFGRSVITDKVRAFVREYYAADYALAKDRLGKEY